MAIKLCVWGSTKGLSAKMAASAFSFGTKGELAIINT